MDTDESATKAKPRPKARARRARAGAAAPNAETLAEDIESPDAMADAMAREDAERAAQQILGANPVIGLDGREVWHAIRRLTSLLALRPDILVREEWSLVRELFRIIAGSSTVAPERGDRRFSHAIWDKNPFYRRVMQAYLAWRQSLFDILESADATPRDKKRARFALSLFTEAVAPTNTVLGNPGSIMRIMQTRGRSLLKGTRNLINDLLENGGMPRQVDDKAFTVGTNLATSPGAVVYRDEVFELVQYAPATAKVHTRPVMIVPPQINKFYIVDLAPGRSFAEYATKSGIQLFVMSWRNPTAAQRDWNLETYVGACRTAVETVKEICDSKDINLMAACAGGFTAATLLGHYIAKGDDSINSVTLLVTVLDSSAETLMGLFASENTIAAAMKRSRAAGVLEGRDMARIFSWLRPNDLVWSFFANNYLMGNDPPAFDILYWNSDTTRLPAEFHADMLSLFLHNPLLKPGALSVLGTPIDMSKVNCDSFVVAGITDHITPWKACYETRRVLGGNMQFVLSSSGHVQSIVNPPNNPKARFYTNTDLSLPADEWLRTAEQHAGSWWDYWLPWITERSGELKDAPDRLGSNEHPPREAAPGRYVHQR